MRRPSFDSIDELPPHLRVKVEAALAKQPPSRGPRPRTVEVAGRGPVRRCAHGCGDGGCVRPGVWRLWLPGRALTTNRFISPLFIKDPGVRAGRTAEVGRTYRGWKEAARDAALGEQVPLLASGWVAMRATYARGGSHMDAGGLAVVGKAVVDGLVQAGVFVDDRPGILTAELYLQPVVDGAGDGVFVQLTAGEYPLQVL